MSLQGDVKPSAEEDPARTSNSFVYPVRSLLSGIRAQSGTTSANANGSPSHGECTPGTVAEGGSDIDIAEDRSEDCTHLSGGDVPPASTADPSSFTKPYPRRREKGSPNFRDFSKEDDPLHPRTFKSSPSMPVMAEGTDPNSMNTFFIAGPVGEPLIYSLDDPDMSERDRYHPRHPPHLSEAAADAFTDFESSTLTPTEEISRPPSASVASNFSQAGYVHLAPLPSSSPRSQSLTSSRGRTRGNSSPAVQNGSDSDIEVVNTNSARLGSVDSGAASPLGSATGSVVETGSSLGSEGRITFRYQHVEDDEGHHLIVGREGELTQCEDEPIRIPGAVQGFGVLIALEEDYETGNLSVRQVSENSAELLGLSPAYLFSLECFTQTLPDSQGDLLLDNIQYLSDGTLTTEEQAENVHVFMLTGLGEPESALPGELNTDPHRRRSWVCWVAAHRPQTTPPTNPDNGTSTSAVPEQNLIVLEFELERDHFNPLYPPVAGDEFFASGISSPSSGSAESGSGSSTTHTTTSSSSGRTLVSSGSDGQLPEGSTPEQMLRSGETSASPVPSPIGSPSVNGTSSNSEEWLPSHEAILESTTSCSKPLIALERLRRNRRFATGSLGTPGSFHPGEESSSLALRGGRGTAARRRRGTGAVGMMDVFSVMAQINEQLDAANDMDTFMKVVVGVIKDLTQFHRVLAYQFDEAWNGKVLAELVDWNQTHDLYLGLHFPASDIPAQARALYALNKVRLLYDRGQPTARLVVKNKRDLETPLDMTHCYLRSMSPIHLKYLGNMGVRSSMSVSIVAFNRLWGLVTCHSYGPHGMRVSFPVRQMLRLISQSISRNVERLSYAQRLHTRKLGSDLLTGYSSGSRNVKGGDTASSDQHPSGYIVSDADDLLGLFDADYGVLVIGEGAKILGPNQHGQEILVVAEYLRLKQFNTIQVSQAVTEDYPDLQLVNGLEVIAGLLYVPLSVGGGDFIAFLRKGQPCQVRWAGRPYKEGGSRNTLEPRTSFKIWSETVAGRCRAWTDEHLETAGVLALVYGKFIEVWRQKESALQTTKLTNILLSNASHEVRTPLNHIINYLEMALNGQLDGETRENLSQSHAASKSLLFTINDLLDLTRLESGGETSFNEPFNLHAIVREATLVYRNEAARRGLDFDVDLSKCPKSVVGDAKKIRTVVANLTANALKYTSSGKVTVECRSFDDSSLTDQGDVAVEIVVSDTGCGMTTEKLESIFREFEQVESTPPSIPSPSTAPQGLGLGLAVVARIVEQLGGQLRVDSKVDVGSRFSFLIPFCIRSDSSSGSSSIRSRTSSLGTREEIESLVNALAVHSLNSSRNTSSLGSSRDPESPMVKDAKAFEIAPEVALLKPSNLVKLIQQTDPGKPPQLRILIVEDNDINRTILAKRLALDGHIVVNTTNGQEGLDMVELDREFDAIFMDIQMPLLNGYEATERIRALEHDGKGPRDRLSQQLNGRIPIFAVSASLYEVQREEMYSLGMDGWILKPIDFKRLRIILRGVTDVEQRQKDVYRPGCSWEHGGWLSGAKKS